MGEKFAFGQTQARQDGRLGKTLKQISQTELQLKLYSILQFSATIFEQNLLTPPHPITLNKHALLILKNICKRQSCQNQRG